MELIYRGPLLDVYSCRDGVKIGTKFFPFKDLMKNEEETEKHLVRVKDFEKKFQDASDSGLIEDQTLEVEFSDSDVQLYARYGQVKVEIEQIGNSVYLPLSGEEKKEAQDLTDFRDCVVWMKGMFKYYNTIVVSTGKVRGSVGPELRVVRTIDRGMVSVEINDVQVLLIPQGNYHGNISVEERQVKGVLKCAKIASMVLDEVRQRATGDVNFTVTTEGISITVGEIEKFRIDLSGRVTYIKGIRKVTREIDLSDLGQSKNYFTFLSEIQWMFEDIRSTLLWTGPEKPGVLDYIRHGLSGNEDEEWIYSGSLFDITFGSIGNYVY